MSLPASDAASRSRLLVSDSGPLIVFAIADLLPVLCKPRGPLLVPSEVLEECLGRPSKPGVREINAALDKGLLLEVRADAVLAKTTFAAALGEGEAAVFSICKKNNYIAVIDEVRARKVARQMGVRRIGSGGLLLELKRAGLIRAVRPVLDIWAGHDYFIATAVREALLQLAGE